MKSVCVYCGAKPDVSKHFLEEAESFGALLAENDFKLIYGGTKHGTMGALADGTLNAGGYVTGVFPEKVFMKHEERIHDSLSEVIHVPDMHARKLAMFTLADAFVIFPGGFGTMDETFEIITWKALGTHSKPIIIYNYRNFYDYLLKLIEHFINTGFANKSMEQMFKVINDKDQIISYLKEKAPVLQD